MRKLRYKDKLCDTQVQMELGFEPTLIPVLLTPKFLSHNPYSPGSQYDSAHSTSKGKEISCTKERGWEEQVRLNHFSESPMSWGTYHG